MKGIKSHSIQDTILMPPPIVHSISNISKSDTSEDLKRNLRGSSRDAYLNRKIHMQLIEDLKREDSSLINGIPKFLKKSVVNLNNLSLNQQKSTNSIENTSDEQNEHLILRSIPKNQSEIQPYVEHLFYLLNKYSHLSSSFIKLKIELETRYLDYTNHALKSDYFKESIIRLQERITHLVQSVLNVKSITYLDEKACALDHPNSNIFSYFNKGSMTNIGLSSQQNDLNTQSFLRKRQLSNEILHNSITKKPHINQISLKFINSNSNLKSTSKTPSISNNRLADENNSNLPFELTESVLSRKSSIEDLNSQGDLKLNDLHSQSTLIKFGSIYSKTNKKDSGTNIKNILNSSINNIQASNQQQVNKTTQNSIFSNSLYSSAQNKRLNYSPPII